MSTNEFIKPDVNNEQCLADRVRRIAVLHMMSAATTDESFIKIPEYLVPDYSRIGWLTDNHTMFTGHRAYLINPQFVQIEKWIAEQGSNMFYRIGKVYLFNSDLETIFLLRWS